MTYVPQKGVTPSGDIAQEVTGKIKPRTVRAWQAGRGGLFYDTTDGVGRERVAQGDWLVQDGEGENMRLFVLNDYVFRSRYEVKSKR